MTEKSNPYIQTKAKKDKAQNVNQANNISPDSAQNIMPKIIGIASILLGAYNLITILIGSVGIFTMFINFKMPSMMFEHMGIAAISTLMSIWLIFIGISLLKYRDIGRRHFTYYAVAAIIFMLAIFGYFQGPLNFNIVFRPILLIAMAIILNQSNVKASLSD